MAQARKRERATVSLFPFLSVLSCVIGTLTLLIAALALGQMADTVYGDTDNSEQLEAERAQRQQELDTLAAQLEHAVGRTRRYDELTAEIQAMESARAMTARKQKGEFNRIAESRNLRNSLDNLDKRLRSLRRELHHVTEKLQSQEKALALSRITLQPSGTGRNLKPHFIECNETGVELYSGYSGISISVEKDRIADSSLLRAYLDRVAGAPNETIILLIRPAGVNVYSAVADTIKATGIKHGKMPLPGHGTIDFGLFESLWR